MSLKYDEVIVYIVNCIDTKQTVKDIRVKAKKETQIRLCETLAVPTVLMEWNLRFIKETWKQDTIVRNEIFKKGKGTNYSFA